MKVNREWLRQHCKVTLSHEVEDTVYLDYFEHPEARAWICEQLKRGNAWAWCQANVTVVFYDFVSTQYLGACSYENEAAFKRCDYYEQLVNEGVEEIAKTLESISLEHGLWEHDPLSCVWCAIT